MTTISINGIPISFPFKPYDIQKDYMKKVIECLQSETNAVLESPTGTGKTLSLLCASLAWLSIQKAKFQAEVQNCGSFFNNKSEDDDLNQPKSSIMSKLMWDVPTIIYASRTHSQLSQAMNELKRSSYSYVKSTVIGSRDQLCIHPDVIQQTNNAAKTCMCKAMVKTRSCYLQNRVEKMSADRIITDMNIVDIEDIIQVGKKRQFCPYYMTRELKKSADIIFLPYNYLLDPKARRANQLDLRNSVIILDEAHNVEKVCEDSASFQIKTTDIALCIDEVTQVMKHMEQLGDFSDNSESEKDFSAEDLALLKTMLLNLEKSIDDIPLLNKNEGSTYEGKFIFEILERSGIDDTSQIHVLNLLEKLIQFMSTSRENPYQRTGAGLQILQDLLLIVFQNVSAEFKEKINKCYKVHLMAEVIDKKKVTQNTWLSKATASKEKSTCRVLSYWCFSPNFGMQMLLEQGVRTVILTSGTLAPLKPLESELGIKIGARLENPHVITNKQIYVKILGTGPDGIPLNSGYQNRDNPKYITSLGMSIINLSRQIPNGLLVFFPSYALLSKCQENWQQSGLWSSMNELKTIYVEPKTKDMFMNMMHDFYDRVKDPLYSGATFMAVCRGKVSEGLDFADINGRAVIIIGLPYPPFKDPRVMLKKKYLDVCRSKDPEYLSGQAWYGLEATRAVNQAIGRVIRHRYDYGAILFLDNRFNSQNVKSQLSMWIRNHVQLAHNFGEVIRDLRLFFKNAVEFDTLREQQKPSCSTVTNVDNSNSESSLVKINTPTKSAVPSTSVIDLSRSDENKPNNSNINKRSGTVNQSKQKKKIKLLKIDYENEQETRADNPMEFIELMKKNLEIHEFQKFTKGLTAYKNTADVTIFITYLNEIFLPKAHLRYLIQGMLPYIKDVHKNEFLKYWESMR